MVERLQGLEGITVPFIELDTADYRDDRESGVSEPQLNQAKSSVDITGKHIFLIDDVLYTGRTIRAAMDALMDRGRPNRISLVVLVDRGHRELPIRPDIIGKNIPTAKTEKVTVQLEEVDGQDLVMLSK